MSTTQTGRKLFWFDCETTGLDPNKDTVLEVSWTFTDENLRMLSPLRQRYTKIVAPATGRDGRRPVFEGKLLDPSDDADWHDNSYISPFVREMHETSGLRQAWINAAETRPRSILTHAQDLYRLVADDLDAAHASPTDQLALAGAGVSHFDDMILSEAFGQLYPRRPHVGSARNRLGSWHFRCFDTSIALWVGGGDPIRKSIDMVLAKAYGPVSDSDDVIPYDVIECPEKVDAEVIHVVHDNEPDWFDRSQLVAHRAADDVVYSLLDARALRYLLTRVML